MMRRFTDSSSLLFLESLEEPLRILPIFPTDQDLVHSLLHSSKIERETSERPATMRRFMDSSSLLFLESLEEPLRRLPTFPTDQDLVHSLLHSLSTEISLKEVWTKMFRHL